MKIIIYPGSEQNISHFRDFCIINSYKIGEEKDEIGNRLIFDSESILKDDLIRCITLYITENYLENYIFCKIYDEYPIIDASEASKILSEFINYFSDSFVKPEFERCLTLSNKINLPSLMLFNIKRIMLTTNKIVDRLCQNHIFPIDINQID